MRQHRSRNLIAHGLKAQWESRETRNPWLNDTSQKQGIMTHRHKWMQLNDTAQQQESHSSQSYSSMRQHRNEESWLNEKAQKQGKCPNDRAQKQEIEMRYHSKRNHVSMKKHRGKKILLNEMALLNEIGLKRRHRSKESWISDTAQKQNHGSMRQNRSREKCLQ